MRLVCIGLFVFVPELVFAQQWKPESPIGPYPPRQGIGVFGEYSPDSSHIVLGVTRQRKFASIGAEFTQRLLVRRRFTLNNMAEVRPFTLWSDPVLKSVSTTYTSPLPTHTVTGFLRQDPPVINTYPRKAPFDFTDPFTGTVYQGFVTYTYGRRYLYAGGASPIGFKLNLLPKARIQPVIIGLGGVVASFRDLPVFNSSAFNFTFSFGVGFEWFRSETNSMRVEYRMQHLSNGYLGATNPGVDSQVIQTTWTWGRH